MRPAIAEEATTQARQRLSSMRAGLAALGVPAEGELGAADPLEAIDKACAGRHFDEIIVATLPRHVSRWPGADLPRQARRRFRLRVTTIIVRMAGVLLQGRAQLVIRMGRHLGQVRSMTGDEVAVWLRQDRAHAPAGA